MGLGGRFLRLVTIVVMVAAFLVPAWVAPARTISVPVTLARTVELGRAAARGDIDRVTFGFAPTHVAFSWTGDEGTGVRYRTGAAEGDTSGWRRAPDDHDAERGRRHFSGVLAVDRPAFIEWKAVTPPGSAVEGLILDYLNTLDGPREERDIPALAQARAREPQIVTRAEWGADESLKRTSGSCVRRFEPVQQLFVHHTAGSNFDDRPKATMRAIYWYHVVRQGWCDVGYNFVVSDDGRIFEGRWARDYASWETHDSETRSGRAVVGAHVSGYNSGAVGISVMGNYSQVRPSPAVRRSLAELIAWEVDRHDLGVRGRHVYKNPVTGAARRLPWVAGHRDAGSTDCPGDLLYSALPGIRRDADAVMGAGKATTSLDLQASSGRVTAGDAVTLSGVLKDQSGAGMPTRPIRSYVREGRGEWAEGPTATTAADGSFLMSFDTRVNLRIAAIYDGDRSMWGSASPDVVVKVEPRVTLTAEGGTADGGGLVHYGPGTAQIRFTGTVVPANGDDVVYVRIAKLGADGTFTSLDEGSTKVDGSGTFSFTWNVSDAGAGGTYRAHAFVPKKKDHTWGASPVVTFVIDPQP